MHQPMQSARRQTEEENDRLWFLEGVGDGDWPEDFDHENGCYFCKCHKCGEQFMGHKRRVTCKVCAGNSV